MSRTRWFVVAIWMCACAVAAGAPVYPPDDEGFIRDWLVAGPYPQSAG